MKALITIWRTGKNRYHVEIEQMVGHATLMLTDDNCKLAGGSLVGKKINLHLGNLELEKRLPTIPKAEPVYIGG